MTPSNAYRLKVIAEGLGDLLHDVVFVGGSVAELYADDPAATDIRPTQDVDCIIELATYGSLQNFEALLRKRKFVNDIGSGIICRWKYNHQTVDIMPDRDDILGFSNQWYHPGIRHRIAYDLSPGLCIYILPPLYYIATKIEAIKGRGGNDLRFSHDFEDIIYVLNNRHDITAIFDHETDRALIRYIAAWAAETLARSNCREEIECNLPYGEYDRTGHIIGILKHFIQ